MIVCICRRVSDRTVLRVIEEGASTVDEVGRACGAGTGCGACQDHIAGMLEDAEAGCPGLCRQVLSPYLQSA
jgi:bacterioferritin-associated ferredoxin